MTLTPLPSAFDLDSQTLRLLAAVAEYGSITRAAGVLGFSQPALSQQIKRVEARIGMPLVTRAGRGIRLTDAGLVIARHAATVLAALESASGELADLAGLRSGQVRLSAFPSASSTIVPQLIRSMGEEHEGVRFTYLEAEPPEAIAAVRDGAIDIAIAFRHPADRDDPFAAGSEGLVVHELARDELLLLVPHGHAALPRPSGPEHPTPSAAPQPASPTAVDLAALRDETWIAGCPRCRAHLLDSCARSGFAPTIAFETDNFVAVMRMVAEGLGVALLPALTITASPLPPGVAAAPTTSGDHRMIVAVTRPGADRIPAVGETMRILRRLTARPDDAPRLPPRLDRSRV
ncbi:LysR family transcriptional regulator [Herbiconiux sp. CPCC 203407]|uniref:LysR family transcriptional regulator n=1 Tax=Herbiconiux oxytropis TaxID=2970915 RepID=A0AA41XHK0_9MICO|nr:LysR family transcriptional regulator [Herbiconiux oxytropis]MCS5724035.1 LysR family transcriptional regulator [Herbiconiux oxytropis]MCS5725096.1 LysR family transcriptional regulator [Herbiconiux oxytropis]